jgi:hypothetical protein
VASGLDAHVSHHPAVRAAAADFGALIRQQPRAVMKASSGARGLGSTCGRALVDDGVVIGMRGLDATRSRCRDGARGQHRPITWSEG